MALPTAHEALIYLMVVTSAADRDMTDVELARIGNVVRAWPIFEGFDDERLIGIELPEVEPAPTAEECEGAIVVNLFEELVILLACRSFGVSCDHFDVGEKQNVLGFSP